MWNVCGMLILTPVFLRSVDRMNDQRTNYGTEDKHSLVRHKAVGSGKAGKALALPDFPPSVHFYINACVPRRTDRCIKRHMRY